MPSSLMFDLYIKFLKDVIVLETRNSVDPISQALKVYENAKSVGCINEDLACQHVSLFLDLGKLEEARKVAEKLCNGELPDSVNLWVLRLSIEMICSQKRDPSLSEDDTFIVFELLRNVLMKFSVSKAEKLWHMVCKYCSLLSRLFLSKTEITIFCFLFSWCRPSSFLRIKDVTLASWWRFQSFYWLVMVVVMMGFLPLLLLSILFFRKMEFRLQEMCINGISIVLINIMGFLPLFI